MLCPNIPKDRYGVIYLITHREDGKQYVGQTKRTIQHRWRGHLQKANKPGKHISLIARSIKCHGPEAFDVEEVDWASSKETLDHKERFWIAFLDTMNPEVGYNLKEGGARGIMCQDALDRMAGKLRGRKLPQGHPFTIKGKTAPMKGRTRKPEWNAAHSQCIKEGFESGKFKGNTGKIFVKNRKAVICVETGQKFDCLYEAGIWIQTLRGLIPSKTWNGSNHIGAVVDNPNRTAHGYHWISVPKLS